MKVTICTLLAMVIDSSNSSNTNILYDTRHQWSQVNRIAGTCTW